MSAPVWVLRRAAAPGGVLVTLYWCEGAGHWLPNRPLSTRFGTYQRAAAALSRFTNCPDDARIVRLVSKEQP